MKKSRRKVAIILLLTLIFTSLELMGVSAEDEGVVKVAPPEVSKLKANSGYQSITLTWKASQGAEGYVVYMKGSEGFSEIKVLPNIETEYRVPDLKKYKTYTFRVTAFVSDATAPGGRLESKPVKVKGQAVREMTYKLQLKAPATLYSHSGKRKKLNLKSGQEIEATHFSTGQYVFYKDGRRYHINSIRVRVLKGVYTQEKNYSIFEAENFINEMKVSSKTKVLIWVNTYTQHVYYFEGSKGKWECTDDWECCTGRPQTPTPTGATGLKKIWTKVRVRHNVPWWSPFSSYNSMHGLAGSRKILGKPASGGCVRNPDDKAKKVYENAKVGTRVVIH
ncbi:MAG: L,D-transpeptidase family protein [Mogibacterium sp.]|nr:L,D-transpeptidase family protein [Mogibacterium sp.]